MYFFDESGDTGNPVKSATNKFIIVVVYFKDIKHLDDSYTKIRSLLNLEAQSKELKWNKLHKESKSKFDSILGKLDIKFVFLIIDKTKIEIFGEDLYKLTLKRIIEQNNLTGTFRFVGTHLNNLLSDLKKELKVFGRKVSFINCKEELDKGVQISDLLAGHILHKQKNHK